MGETLNAVVKHRSQSAAVLTTTNPILYKGELGIESDTRKFKFGDGITPWNSLTYASFDQVSPYMLTVLLAETAKTARAKLLTNITNVNAINSDYTILDGDQHELIEATAGSGGIGITLPTLADNLGRVIKIIKVDSSAGTVSIAGEGSETINGKGTQTLSSLNSAITMYAGTDEWKIINAGTKSTLTVEAITEDYTILDTDNINILEVTTGDDDITVTLPTLADNQGRQLVIKKVDSGNGSVFVTGEGAETIEGVPSLTIVSRYNSVTIYAGSSEWGGLSQPTTAESKAVGEIFAYAPPYELDGCKFMNYALLSQTVYAELFSKIGHLYAKTAADAAAAQAAGKFYIPDGHFLFMRGGQSWNITQAAISTSTKYITIPSHGITQNGRAIKLQRFPGQTPTLPTDTSGYYTEYNQLYLAVVDADHIRLYDTEANAITNDGATGLVSWSDAGSGTFLLTTQGCYQSDAFQGHKVRRNIQLGPDGVNLDTSYVAGLASIAGSNVVESNIVESIYGPPRQSNETRPAYASLGMQIKVIAASVSTGAAYDMEVWDSGWIDVSSKGANQTLELVHNLNEDFDNLIVKGYGKTDMVEPAELYLIYSAGSGEYGGNCVGNGSKNSFLYSGGSVEFGRIRRSDNNGVVNPTYMRFVVYKPSFFAVTKASTLVTMTASGSVSLEQVERTAIIPATIEESLDITIVAGAGINEANVIWLKNKSAYIQHVLYGGQSFNIAPGQRAKFRISDSALVWASAGWETIWKNPSSQRTVPEAELLRPVTNNQQYSATVYESSVSDYDVRYSVIDNTKNNYSGWLPAGTGCWTYWDASTRSFTANSTVNFIEIRQWHEEA